MLSFFRTAAKRIGLISSPADESHAVTPVAHKPIYYVTTKAVLPYNQPFKRPQPPRNRSEAQAQVVALFRDTSVDPPSHHRKIYVTSPAVRADGLPRINPVPDHYEHFFDSR